MVRFLWDRGRKKEKQESNTSAVLHATRKSRVNAVSFVQSLEQKYVVQSCSVRQGKVEKEWWIDTTSLLHSTKSCNVVSSSDPRRKGKDNSLIPCITLKKGKTHHPTRSHARLGGFRFYVKSANFS
ncbi:hypothetical protein A2738_01635 [Candidatus Nomurabacteria bacterium RIFCSPHIGHO2_01_FULL_42_15]|uniref:Uncharacterized protein n=1 Tax=Candidatus Nomurabacteria bacterium RIFCSPHIGHO2_01_FULL_42_15 TaxID=1801742 RepID=A0A1F6VG30_9BACT|nr:MAG: hypothetical protein A2738_01635 [Candidatus Nomurabacteria bacterium RIFCSPHIGHO2_01_FULL_42_15]OGI93012.1 MAG: hypothetical protein A3A99_00535 [Candidatus Nomurabacteria bacterium RIFCSPLOWO2_01_FULL_41_18]